MLGVVACLLGGMTPAAADSRMAGSRPPIINLWQGGGDTPKPPHESSPDGVGLDQPGMDETLWRGTSLSWLQETVPALPDTYRYKAQRELVIRLLLAQNDPGQIEPDTQEGPGFFALRLEKLVSMGALQEAMALYTRASGLPVPAAAHDAGLRAMFGLGEYASACLELKGRNLPADTRLRQEAQHFCRSFLGTGDGPGADDGASGTGPAVSWAEFNGMSAPERAAWMTAGNRPEDGARYPDARELSSEALATLLAAPEGTLPEQTVFAVLKEAARRHMTGPDAWAGFYETIAAAPRKQAPSHAAPLYIRLAELYRRTRAAGESGDRTAAHLHALGAIALVKGQAGTASMLSPFAPDLRIPIAGRAYSARELVTIANVHLLSNMQPERSWLRIAEKKITATKADAPGRQNLPRVALSLAASPNTEDFFRSVAAMHPSVASYEKPGPGNYFSQFSILFSTLRDFYGNKKACPYDKNFNYVKNAYLTDIGNYVMPSVRTEIEDGDGPGQKQLGKLVLLSTLATSEAFLTIAYPRLLQGTIRSLDSVGLNTDSQKLAREVLFGLIYNEGE